MKANSLVWCILLVSIGGLWGWPSLSRANLGESFSQINARYGKPIKRLPDSLVHDKTVSIYRYEFNGRRVFITFMNGKSVSEAIRAPEESPHFDEKTCLAIATKISGRTNWAELTRSAGDVAWVAGDATAGLHKNPGTPDYVFVSTVDYTMNRLLSDPDVKVPFPRPIGTNAQSKAGEAVTNAAAKSLERTNSAGR